MVTSQTDDYECDDYQAVDTFHHLQEGPATEPRAQNSRMLSEWRRVVDR